MKAIEKAEAALSLLLQEGCPPSLLEICRMAGINRSNIYEHHPRLFNACARCKSRNQSKQEQSKIHRQLTRQT